MSIHLKDIETLLNSYTKSHSVGAIKASGNLIPHLIKAVVALVEEKTGGAQVPSTLAASGPAAPAAQAPASETDPNYNPLGVIEDHFTAVANVVAAAEAINDVVAVHKAEIAADAGTVTKNAKTLAADSVKLAAEVAAIKDVATAAAVAPALLSDAVQAVSDVKEAIADAEGHVADATALAKDLKQAAKKPAPKKA